jgi:hypothetical protein
MIAEWILIVRLLTPGGDFIEQNVYEVKGEKACHKMERQAKTQVNPMKLKYETACVTKEHYTGLKPMPNQAMD